MINPASSGHSSNVGEARGRDITDEEWAAYETAAKDGVAARIESAQRDRPRSTVAKFGQAAFLLSLREATNLGKRRNKTLAQVDDDAHRELELRHGLIQAKHAELLQDPSVQSVLRTAYDDAVTQTLGNRTGRAADYQTYLLSDAFWRTVRYKRQSDRTEILAACLGRLGALDPAAAEAVANGWIARDVHADPLAALLAIPHSEAEKAARDLLDYLAECTDNEREQARLIPPRVRAGNPSGPTMSVHECLAEPEQRRAIAQALTRSLRAPRLREQLQRCDTRQIFNTLQHYDVRGAHFADALTRCDAAGRGIGAFFSLWSLVAIAETFPFRDGNGKVRREQVAAGSQALIGLAADASAFARFFNEGLAKRLTVPCRAFSVVGSAVSLYFAARGVGQEMKNHDAVGVTANVLICVGSVGTFSLGLSVACGGAACPPLLLLSFGIILGAALLDGFFGQSALTGKIKQHLEALGIQRQESSARRTFDRSQRNKTRTAVRQSGATTNLSLTQRLALINSCMMGRTNSYEEATVWKVFADTRSQPQAFVYLIESSDPARISEELEHQQEAADVLIWTLRAYVATGRPPGRGFDEQLVELCRAHRWQPLRIFIREVADEPDLNRAYDRIAPETLERACDGLMDGPTGSGAEEILCHLLAFASERQVEALFRYDTVWARRVRSELTDEQWARVRKHVVRHGESKGVQYTLDRVR